jgi:hypothetical protein
MEMLDLPRMGLKCGPGGKLAERWNVHDGLLLPCRAFAGDFGCNARHQIRPGFDEGGRTVVLEPPGKTGNVDAGLGELRKHFGTVATVGP